MTRKILKKILVLYILISSFCLVSTALPSEKHPSLFFDDITEAPGWKYVSLTPYDRWDVPHIADASSSYDFSDPTKSEVDKAQRTRALAMAYAITGNTSYGEQGVYALNQIGTGNMYNPYIPWALKDYSVAYDLLWEYIQVNHFSDDASIRNSLGELADTSYDSYYDNFIKDPSPILQSLGLGVAATVLSNYSSPYDSGPDDWLTAGTTWLFEEYPPRGASAMSVYHNLEGFENGQESYADAWYIYELEEWLFIYKKNYEDPFSKWNISRNFMNYFLKNSLPNGYRPNYGTEGNMLRTWSFYGLGMLPEEDGKQHKWYIENYLSECTDQVLGYVLYDKYAVTSLEPSFDTSISKESESAFFRGDWSKTSDYLWLRAIYQPLISDRKSGHSDNMGLIYYSKGDYLLPESGEVRTRWAGYGPTDSKGHNIIMINNAEGKTGGPVKGRNGLASFDEFTEPAEITDYLIGENVEFAEASMPSWTVIENRNEIDEENGQNWQGSTGVINLDDPVSWQRSVVYPNKEYFILLDTITGNQNRQIDTLLHLGSFDQLETGEYRDDTDLAITSSTTTANHNVAISTINTDYAELMIQITSFTSPGTLTAYVNNNYVGEIEVTKNNWHYIHNIPSSYFTTSSTNTIRYEVTSGAGFIITYTRIFTVGNVIGELMIEDSGVNWLDQGFAQEVNQGTGSKIEWQTSNIDDADVELTLFTIPESTITIEKYWAKIGGYYKQNEIDHPIVRFKINDDDMYRITSFDTRYLTESEKQFTEISLTGGEGSALKISADGINDIVTLSDGSATITADVVKTDARISFTRSDSGGLDHFFINDGREYWYDSTLKFNASKDILASLQFTSSSITGNMNGDGSYQVAIRTGFDPEATINYVKFNGVEVSSYVYLNGIMSFTVSGAGEVEISSGNDLGITSTDVFFSTNPWNATYTTLSATVWNLGGEAVGPFTIKFYDNGSEIDSKVVSTISKGESTTQSIQWLSTPERYHTITVDVDALDQVDETDETNNQVMKSVWVAYQPDLWVTPPDISFSDTTPQVGQSITVSAIIHNSGGNDTQPVVRCYDGYPDTSNMIEEKTLAISKESTAQATFAWIPSSTGTHGIYITIDPSNEIDESDEENNLHYKNIVVSGTTTSTTTASTTTQATTTLATTTTQAPTTTTLATTTTQGSTTSTTGASTTTQGTNPTTTTTTSTTSTTCEDDPALLAGDNEVEYYTPHPYTNNYDNYSLIYSCPSGYNAKVHTRYDTEYYYDFFYLYDASSGDYTRYSGNSSGYVWLDSATRSIQMRFKSDNSYTEWGLDVDYINCYLSASTTTTTQDSNPTTTSTPTYSTTTLGPTQGDCNTDGVVDFSDLLILAQAYDSNLGDSEYDSRADFNGDNRVDFSDLLVLAENYSP